jgi:hypothetical protein
MALKKHFMLYRTTIDLPLMQALTQLLLLAAATAAITPFIMSIDISRVPSSQLWHRFWGECAATKQANVND